MSDLSVPTKQVLIRCDGSSLVGFGHLVRCLALADELRDSTNAHIAFASLEGASVVNEKGYLTYHPHTIEKNFDEGKWLESVIIQNSFNVLILDVRTQLSLSSIDSIRLKGVLVVTIDDPSPRRLHADLAFYPPAPQVKSLNWIGFKGQLFVGWDWIILRSQFANSSNTLSSSNNLQPTSLINQRTKSPVLLVTMGGSDPAGLTMMSLRSIDMLQGDFRVLVVIGRGFMHAEVLSKWLTTCSRTYEICRDVSDMAHLMIEADLAVASFGVTAYELAALKVPSILLCLTSEHSEASRCLVNEGIATNMGEYINVKAQDLAVVIANKIEEIRVGKTWPADKCLIDGLASKRISQIISQK